MKRPMVICTIECDVAVWMAVPMVKMSDQNRIEFLRPSESEVNACASAPTKVLRSRSERGVARRGAGRERTRRRAGT
jgi:hypothetical protein